MNLLFDQNLSRRLVSMLAKEFPGSSHVALLGLATGPFLAREWCGDEMAEVVGELPGWDPHSDCGDGHVGVTGGK